MIRSLSYAFSGSPLFFHPRNVETTAGLDACAGYPICEPEERVGLGVGGEGPAGSEGERRIIAFRACAGHQRSAAGLVKFDEFDAALGERVVNVAWTELVVLLG